MIHRDKNLEVIFTSKKYSCLDWLHAITYAHGKMMYFKHINWHIKRKSEQL